MLEFQTDIIANIIKTIGWTETETTGNLQARALLRSRILQEAVKNNHRPTVETALKYFQMIKQGKRNEIPLSPDVFGAIFDAGIIYGTLNDYKFVEKLFKESTFAPDQIIYLNALGSSPVPYIQTRSLGFALSGSVRKQDIRTLITRVATSTPIGHVTTWMYLIENWESFVKIGEGAGTFGQLNALLETICSLFTKQYLISEAERLFVDQVDKDFIVPAGAKTSVLKGLEKAKQYLAWRQIYGPTVSYWLETKGY